MVDLLGSTKVRETEEETSSMTMLASRLNFPNLDSLAEILSPIRAVNGIK